MSGNEKKSATAKNTINFKRPTPPVLVPVLHDAQKIEDLKAEITAQATKAETDYTNIDSLKVNDNKIDYLGQDSPKNETLDSDSKPQPAKTPILHTNTGEVQIKEPRCKTLIREALLRALGNEKEVVINQAAIASELKLAHQTWVKHISALRQTDFVLIRQPRGTILRKR